MRSAQEFEGRVLLKTEDNQLTVFIKKDQGIQVMGDLDLF